jgi:hypothetical protein
MSLRSIALAGAVLLASGLAFTACGKQSEAMRCEVDDDCDTNLKCSNVGFADRICCPSDRARSTTNECKFGPTVQDTGVAETTPVVDTGTAEVAADTMMTSETAADTGTAPPVDAADAD